MNILLTNDDGYQAEGLNTLHETLCAKHELTVIAPDRQYSAFSHAITLNDPIKVAPLSQVNGYAVHGTPVDCVNLAFWELLPQKPDLVLSGINHGANTGNNAVYSGTLAAAGAAAKFGAPALAVSQEWVNGQEIFFATAAKFADYLIALYPTLHLPPGIFLSVNVPNLPLDKIKGFKLAPQSSAKAAGYYDKYKNNQGDSYYWLMIDGQAREVDGKNDDISVLAQGYIAITPMQYDLSNSSELARLDTYMRHLPAFQD
jgi:5'-nucleotidase